MIEALVEAVFELVGEAIFELLSHLFSGSTMKGLDLAREIWAMFLGR